MRARALLVITIYGADWCSDCRRAKNVLDAAKIAYEYLQVDRDPAAMARAIEISGAKSIPVVVFSDGSYLIEPDVQALLGAARRTGATRSFDELEMETGGGD
jgi:glutaredoxin